MVQGDRLIQEINLGGATEVKNGYYVPLIQKNMIYPETGKEYLAFGLGYYSSSEQIYGTYVQAMFIFDLSATPEEVNQQREQYGMEPLPESYFALQEEVVKKYVEPYEAAKQE